MKNLVTKSLKYIYKLESKIAFYPTILSLGGMFFAFLMIFLESKGISGYLIEHMPLLVVNDGETARSLLTTFIAGLISIMVFSFSMVMILLNQASSNFSPRVLPGLISNSRHQIILGIYNATLLYCIFTLVSIEPDGNKYQLPGFSVLLGIVSMTLCLGAFIYFIHSISQEIQINNIMSRIFSTANSRLKELIDNQNTSDSDFPDTDEWNILTSTNSGYIQDISTDSIVMIAKENNLQFEIVPSKGFYSLKNSPLLKYSKSCSDKIKEDLLSAFHYSKSELIEDNYILAFKQLAEIAVKAMSPGINDPGTAINAIDYLTELFLLRIQKNDKIVVLNEEGKPLLLESSISFKQLISNTLAALRMYCKSDILIVEKLMHMLSLLLSSDNIAMLTSKDVVKQEIEKLYEDASKSINNKTDLKELETYFNTL
ncbi:DUF2254 domain-containing protein [Winogradskyella luteola]|uniref:DUF2254 domain-containing protein n=1 Tax=Winogradskyella luteola TaxID=2828330 RepID=A0A9X1F9F4_9FLAO|nr:DUF2254 domain-containing protein [Winogradskyella luteola]MBV7269526.1 DUF2254 domain-containing protein [Winogradskyella luteola]